MKRILSRLETIGLSRYMEENALTPEKDAYKPGWDDEAVAKSFSEKMKLKEPINQFHVRGMRMDVYNFHVAAPRKISLLNAEVLRILSQVPGIRTDVNQQEAWAAFRLSYNKWANDLREACKPKETK